MSPRPALASPLLVGCLALLACTPMASIGPRSPGDRLPSRDSAPPPDGAMISPADPAPPPSRGLDAAPARDATASSPTDGLAVAPADGSPSRDAREDRDGASSA